MRKTFIILFALFSFFHAISQTDESKTYDRVNLPSANAASLKAYTDIPVSGYTGLPQIAIPLDGIDLNFIHIPINISYHASGYKPETQPSWVGLGWNLNAGGMITRSVKCYRDEHDPKDADGENGWGGPLFGAYYSCKALDKPKWYYYSSPNDISPEYGVRISWLDLDPDEFSFNFLGYSGKFYLDHKREWKVRSEYPFKVIMEESDIKAALDFPPGSKYCFSKFTLIDGLGNKYIFGGEDAIEFSVSTVPKGYDYYRDWKATSWGLKKIITADEQEIDFVYERGPYQSHFTVCETPLNVSFNGGDMMKAHNYSYGKPIFSGSISSPIYLKEIDIPTQDLKVLFETSKSNDLNYYNSTYTADYEGKTVPQGYLNFDPIKGIPFFARNPKEKDLITPSNFSNRFFRLKLDKIKFQYNSTNFKTVTFHYKENTESRLRLDSISVEYPASNQPETYRFEYHPNLPLEYNTEYEYLSEYCDKWGYSNHKFIWRYGFDDDHNFSPAKETAKFGVLSKIIYPTRGATQFMYENNDCSENVLQYRPWPATAELQSMGPHYLVGGLRIKRIVNTDNLGNYTSTEYSYNKALNGNITESSGIATILYGFRIGDNSLFSRDGMHVRYSHVIEKYNDNSFKATIYSSERGEYRYYNYYPGIMDDAPIYGATDVMVGGYLQYSSREFERGKPLDEFMCDPTGRVLKSTHYYYDRIAYDSTNCVRAIDRMITRFVSPGYLVSNNTTQLSASYYNYCYYCKPVKKLEFTYINPSGRYNHGVLGFSQESAVKTETDMEYDKFGQLVKSIVKGNNKEQQTVIKYPYTDNPSSGILAEMVSRNMLSYPVEVRSYANTTLAGGKRYNYARFDDKVLLSSVENIRKDNTSNLEYENTKYNGGRLIERRYKSDLYESYLWNMSGTKILAKGSNISIDELNTILPNGYVSKGILTNDYSNEINLLKKQLSASKQLITFDYHPGNGLLKEQGSVNDIKTSYEYDNNNRLGQIRDHNNKLLTNYTYSYSKYLDKNVFLNQELELGLSKDCPQGYTSEPVYVPFTIPSGVALSHVSQNDANNMARQKFSDKTSQLIEDSCKCIPAGTYTFYKIDSNDPICKSFLQVFNLSYKNTTIFCNALQLQWQTIQQNDYVWYNNDSPGVIIGRIEGNKYPSSTKRVEFIDSRANKVGNIGNTWLISIDSSGTIRVKLKNYDIDKMPANNEMINFIFKADILN